MHALDYIEAEAGQFFTELALPLIVDPDGQALEVPCLADRAYEPADGFEADHATLHVEVSAHDIEAPQQGDLFQFDGVRYTATSVISDGIASTTYRIRLAVTT